MHKYKLHILLQLSVSALIIVMAIGFVGKKQEGKTVKKVIVNIAASQGNYYLIEQDILALINDAQTPYILGEEWAEISLKKIEKRIKSNKFVQDVQAFRDLEGNMIIDVEQCTPIARIVTGKGSGNYITDRGNIIPLSNRYTARVMTLDGGFFEQLAYHDSLSFEHTPLFEMINFIKNDKFWSAQVAHLHIDKKEQVAIYPQVSKQLVEFGELTDIEEKFRKLRIFYDKILPWKGWNSYDRVNVAYKGQIICE